MVLQAIPSHTIDETHDRFLVSLSSLMHTGTVAAILLSPEAYGKHYLGSPKLASQMSLATVTNAQVYLIDGGFMGVLDGIVGVANGVPMFTDAFIRPGLRPLRGYATILYRSALPVDWDAVRTRLLDLVTPVKV
jgi:hypothetical protein